MGRFLIKVLAVACLWGCGIVGVATVRIIAWQKENRQCHSLEDGQDVLFIGDSHVGCGISSAPQFHNKIIWIGGFGPQFTLMRLLEMERSGEIKKVKVLFMEAGYPIACEHEKERLKRNWKSFLPVSWRYASLLPVPKCELFAMLMSDVLGKISLASLPPRTIPFLQRSEEWRQNNLMQEYETHFNCLAHPDVLAKGWKDNLKITLLCIKSLCDKHSVRLIFYSSPLSSIYRNGINEERNRIFAEYSSLIKSLGVDFYDFRAACPDEDFMDSHHLLHERNLAFTKMLYERSGVSLRTDEK